MPSNRVKDSVDIYRFKITRKGASKIFRNGEWQYNEDHEEVEFIGFYTGKYRYDPWIPKHGTLKIEHQKLTARYDADPIMSWETIETKSYKDGERDD
jgi:hypothetical protein